MESDKKYTAFIKQTAESKMEQNLHLADGA